MPARWIDGQATFQFSGRTNAQDRCALCSNRSARPAPQIANGRSDSEAGRTETADRGAYQAIERLMILGNQAWWPRKGRALCPARPFRAAFSRFTVSRMIATWRGEGRSSPDLARSGKARSTRPAPLSVCHSKSPPRLRAAGTVAPEMDRTQVLLAVGIEAPRD
jgi:hypothetical protein